MSFSLTAVRRLLLPGVAAATLAFGPAVRAEIHIGVVLSLTGPGASLGIPEENALKLWTGDLAGEKVRFTVLNDNTDSTTAAKNTQKLITEEKVDLILGSSLTPPSLAVVETAGQAGVPVISLAGGGAIVLPQEGPRKWAFKLSPTEQISVTMVIDHVLKNKGKTIATIGVSNSYGEGFLKVTEQVAAAKGVKVVAVEKSPEALVYARRNCAGSAVDVLEADVTLPSLLADRNGTVDLLVSNPPYIPEGAELDPEVADHDPAAALFGGPDGMSVRTVVRSGCYLTHDDGLYSRTTPLGRSDDGHLEPALSVWAQVLSRPEPDLAIVGMGRRDVSFDQDLPMPYGRPDSRVERLNDQHAYLRLAPADQSVRVGDWLEFGVSHPCTVFDKWQLIPVLDADHRVVELVRTFF